MQDHCAQPRRAGNFPEGFDILRGKEVATLYGLNAKTCKEESKQTSTSSILAFPVESESDISAVSLSTGLGSAELPFLQEVDHAHAFGLVESPGTISSKLWLNDGVRFPPCPIQDLFDKSCYRGFN